MRWPELLSPMAQDGKDVGHSFQGFGVQGFRV